MMNAMEPESDKNTEYDIFKGDDLPRLEVMEEGAAKNETTPAPTGRRRRSKRTRRLIQAVIAAGIITSLVLGGLALFRSNSEKPDTNVTINTQSLDNGTLNQLTAESGGASKQQLTITPDTLFQNNVTVNKDLMVQGQTI